MKVICKTSRTGSKQQQGVTLIELMVAMVISLIASTAMVLLMANTMGTGTQTIQMTRLTQEMRTAMQLMTRDLRRANFHSNFAKCFGDITNCNLWPTQITAITPVGEDCFRYWYDRNVDGAPDPGAFQRYKRGAVSVLQISDTDTDACGDDWGVTFDITDGDIFNVTAFTVSDAESYNEPISATDTQDVSKIRLTMTAELSNRPQGIAVSRTIEDLIFVRNNVIRKMCPAGVCPAP